MIEVTITRRHDDFHACITGNSAVWDCGRTPAEAVGNLIITHAKDLKVDLTGVISAPEIVKLACYNSEHVTSMDAMRKLNPSLKKTAMVEMVQVRFNLKPDAAWVMVSRYWNERGL